MKKFRNYYLACRHGSPSGGMPGTSAWRAFKFAALMYWWWVTVGRYEHNPEGGK